VPLVLGVTLPNVNRPLKFFYCWNAHEISFTIKLTLVILATPQVCCCITFGSQKFEIAANLDENAKNALISTYTNFDAFTYLLIICLLIFSIYLVFNIFETTNVFV